MVSGSRLNYHVACEIAKARQHHGHRRELYFLRDKAGVKVDFAVPMGARRLALVEAKTTRAVLPRMGDPMRLFMRATKGYQCQGWIVHPGPDLPGFTGAGEGVHACWRLALTASRPTALLAARPTSGRRRVAFPGLRTARCPPAVACRQWPQSCAGHGNLRRPPWPLT